MGGNLKMSDFVDGGCLALTHAESFVNTWLATKGNPCPECGENKAKCKYYKELVENSGLKP
jgi:hypothetical protein